MKKLKLVTLSIVVSTVLAALPALAIPTVKMPPQAAQDNTSLESVYQKFGLEQE